MSQETVIMNPKTQENKLENQEQEPKKAKTNTIEMTFIRTTCDGFTSKKEVLNTFLVMEILKCTEVDLLTGNF